MKWILAIALLWPTVTLAQQVSPAETALQINTIVSQWATTLIQQSRQIEELQKQLAVKDTKIKELESKAK